jgi:hypothetical protein
VLPASAPDLPLASVTDVAAFLATTINETRRGQLDPRVANSMGALCGQLLRALEGGNLAARIEALEAVLKLRNRRIKK